MNINIYYGPDSAFNEFILEHEEELTPMNEVMLHVVERDRSITHRVEGVEIEHRKYSYETIVCPREGYSSMTKSLINNVLLLFQSVECDSIYFQNPPDNIVKTLKGSYDLNEVYYDYGKFEVDMLINLKGLFLDRIIGQDMVLKMLLPVINISRIRRNNKPIVIMFYGPPGVGKTETAKVISEAIYKNDSIKRFQLSMYQTEHSYQFLFGSNPQDDSLAKDLLSRETNVVLLDEFDKVNPNLYSAFYELFDEGRLVDRNFTAKADNAIFICTSNFLTEKEIRDRVGPAIFSRITECIKFNELDKEVKHLILERKFNKFTDSLRGEEREILSSIGKQEMLTELESQLRNMTDSREITNTIEKYLSYKVLKERGIL